MKKLFNCLGCMLVFFCLLGSCSMLGFEQEHFSSTEEASPKEKETASDEETVSEDESPIEEENPDELQYDPQDNTEKIQPAPALVQCEALPENEIVFEFSGPVSLESLSFEPDLEFEKIEEEGNEIIIKLTGDPAPGLLVEAELQVKDEHENIINEQVSFNIRNNRVPQMQINELRTEYASASGNSGPKAEFIEFKMLSDGNLGALRVFAEWNNKAPQIYEFEPVDVKEGEYVVLHLRKLEDSCKDEYGEDLNISGGTDSSPTARDFWIPGTNKLLHKTDAIYVLDQDDRVLDAVMLSESPSASWGKTYFTEAAKFLFEHDAWKSPTGEICSPMDAVDTSGIKASTAKSISRKEDAGNTHTAADWYVTTQGVTPGLPNKL